MGAIHKSNFGSFGDGLPVDLDGFTHTTTAGWMSARMDGLAWDGYSYVQRRDACRDMAAKARKAIRDAQREVNAWRRNG